MRYVNLNNLPSDFVKRLKEDVTKISKEGTKVVLYKNNGQLPFSIECHNERAANTCYNQFNRI